MAGAASPTLSARNAKFQSGPGKRRSSVPVPAAASGPLVDRKGSSRISSKYSSKGAVNPYVVIFLLVVMSGGAIFQVLKLFGAVDQGDEDNIYF
ncbi:hypothetical protein EMPS_09659 [Entomortierella parvispora]|uniref:Stress-associated endoplasmic reticulum protein n=1 Tax=Entomortierella parvispora TaxID=205924 RepID=A0A9P3HIP6_9FUNG|nr:hypothetical protein EMPS_09659 [Entomortierella parvispora]